MQLSLSVVIAVTLAVPPLVRVTSDACYGCHEGALRDSHPVAVEHRPTNITMQLRPASLPSGLGSTVADDLLVNGRVECTSCHATHEQEWDRPFRLRTGDHVTPLCIACHVLER